jgi:hypothetical protein
MKYGPPICFYCGREVPKAEIDNEVAKNGSWHCVCKTKTKRMSHSQFTILCLRTWVDTWCKLTEPKLVIESWMFATYGKTDGRYRTDYK